MMKHTHNWVESVNPSVEDAVRVIEANRHWIYKQCSEELERAILKLLEFTKSKLA